MNLNLSGIDINRGIDTSLLSGQVGAAAEAGKTDGIENGMADGALKWSAAENGVSGALPLKMPSIDSPFVVEEGKIASLCAKMGVGDLLNLSPAQIETVCDELSAQLSAFADSLKAGGETSGIGTPGESRSVMFDIYALMALLVECGQKMRDAARDVRQAENRQVQTSIQNQADMQRNAAVTGLICSVAVCAIQIGMQGANVAYQAKGFGQQMNAHKNAGLADAKAQLKTAEMQCKPQDAQANYEAVAQKTSASVKAKIESTFNDSRTTKASFDDVALQQRIDAKTAELNGLRGVDGNGNPLPRTAAQEARAAQLESEIAVDTGLKNMSLADRQTLYRTQVKSELADIRNNPASTPEEIAYAEAYAANEIAQNSTPQQLADDLSAAQANFNQANTMMQHDVAYMKGAHVETRARIFGDMITAIGSVVQGCVSSASEMMRADATEQGAEQQKSQEMLDQAKDLFSQCQSLIDSVIQLMQAVLQAEVQSMRDAIQA